MKKTFKYNLNYIGGIAEYQKRAIYTLNLKENSFSVDGIFKSRKFSYNDIIEVKYGEIEELKKQMDPVNVLLFGRMALLDRRLNRKLKYCLAIILKEEMTIVFAEEYDGTIKTAYNTLSKIYKMTGSK